MMDLKVYYTYKKFLNELIKNQYNTSITAFQDIDVLDRYKNLLSAVIKLIKENPKASISTLRFQLFKDSGIKELVDDFVKDTRITPSIVLDYGTDRNRETILCGLRQEYIYKDGMYVYEPLPVEQDTIFDLASTSKLFTALATLKLEEKGLIDVFEPITKYAPEFKLLNDVTVFDLLKFRVPIVTDKRVDSAKNKEEALAILRTVHKKDSEHIKNAYTDMGAMVLRCVVENVAKMHFSDFVEEEILKPAKMEDTYLRVPVEKINRVANENYSSTVDKDGNIITRYNNYPGTPHDPKAIAIGELDGVAPGHAGYFSTRGDMLKLGKALINGQIISFDRVLSMSDTATGYEDFDGWSRFYGSLVYLKQPDPHNLSVYPLLSGKAFMSPGFAGTTLVVDPINKLYLFIGANRLHNRIYDIHSSQQRFIVENPDTHKKTYKSPITGEEKIVCSEYTGNKEIMVTKALDLTLQLQFLEKLMPKEKELILVRELN